MAMNGLTGVCVICWAVFAKSTGFKLFGLAFTNMLFWQHHSFGAFNRADV